MKDERQLELFSNLLTWVWNHTGNCSSTDENLEDATNYAFALQECGFNTEEIRQELRSEIMLNEEQIHRVITAIS